MEKRKAVMHAMQCVDHPKGLCSEYACKLKPLVLDNQQVLRNLARLRSSTASSSK
jgi:hypothetical protein